MLEMVLRIYENDSNNMDSDVPELEDSAQQFDSKITSINSTKLPTLFKLVKFKPNTVNLDFGGGKFDNVTEYLKEQNVTNLVYDKFNRSASHNNEVLSQIKSTGGADTVTCSNVLNVIAEPEVRLTVIKNCAKLLKSGGTCYFTVYEGNGSEEGRSNKTRQSHQTNMKTASYIPELEQVFSSVIKKGKLLVCKK